MEENSFDECESFDEDKYHQYLSDNDEDYDPFYE